ncbi:MAG: hypothetical protein U5L04_02090 [Trueperaceae bacterium]|nr:hypothetical protein [Trueperaceae bacterium]
MPDEIRQPKIRDVADAFGHLNQLFAVLLERAEHDPELRTVLRELAQSVLALTEDDSSQTTSTTPSETTRETPDVRDVVVPDGVPDGDAPEPASPEDIDRLLVAQRSAPTTPSDDDEAINFEAKHLPFDAERVTAHVRLKARACRWLEQYGYTTDPEAIAYRNALKDEAREAGCALWMFDPNVVNPYASDVIGQLAENYRQLAEVVALWQRYRDDDRNGAVSREAAKDVARLLAEVQAAVRVTVAEVRSDGPERLWFDPDQNAVFQELRDYAQAEQVYLGFLRLEHPVDPGATEARDERRLSIERRVELHHENAEWRRKQLNQIGYHAKKVANRSHNPEHDWGKITTAVEDLIADGMPESDLGLREALRPLASLPADQVPPEGGVARALLSLSQASQRQTPPPLPESAPSESVLRLRQLLGGGTVVVIGGEPRRETVQQYERAWACEVNWIESQPHQSIYHFEPYIARDEAKLVLLLIRWSSHVFSEVKRFCDEHDALIVRLPGGYSVNTATHEVLEQVGERLELAAEQHADTKSTLN